MELQTAVDYVLGTWGVKTLPPHSKILKQATPLQRAQFFAELTSRSNTDRLRELETQYLEDWRRWEVGATMSAEATEALMEYADRCDHRGLVSSSSDMSSTLKVVLKEVKRREESRKWQKSRRKDDETRSQMNENARKSKKKFKENEPLAYAEKRKLEDEQARAKQDQAEEQFRLRYKSVRQQFRDKLLNHKGFTMEEACTTAIQVYPYCREQVMPFSERVQKDKMPSLSELAELTKVARSYLRTLPEFFREALEEYNTFKSSDGQLTAQDQHDMRLDNTEATGDQEHSI